MSQEIVQTARPAKFYKPESFKDFGAAILSLILICLLVWALWRTYSLVNVTPMAVKVGDHVQVVDTFDRAKELLNVLFPLFGAVISFWLGVAIESKRAEQNKEIAQRASTERDEVMKKVNKAFNTISEAKDRAINLRGIVEGLGLRSKHIAPLEELIKILEDGQKTIMG